MQLGSCELNRKWELNASCVRTTSSGLWLTKNFPHGYFKYILEGFLMDQSDSEDGHAKNWNAKT